MNSESPHVRPTEMVASPLESFGGQKVSNETYAQARALRRWIAEHPDCQSQDIPQELRGYLEFLMRRGLVTWSGKGGSKHCYRVKPV